MPNIERLMVLRDWLANGAQDGRLTFDMGVGLKAFTDNPDRHSANFAECKTNCCIAGAATIFFNDAPKLFRNYPPPANILFLGEHTVRWRVVQREATELLGLDEEDASRLFTPDLYGVHPLSWYGKPKLAAAVLEELIRYFVTNPKSESYPEWGFGARFLWDQLAVQLGFE